MRVFRVANECRGDYCVLDEGKVNSTDPFMYTYNAYLCLVHKLCQLFPCLLPEDGDVDEEKFIKNIQTKHSDIESLQDLIGNLPEVIEEVP